MRPRSSFHRCGLLSSQPKAMIFPSSQSHRPHLPLQSNFIVVRNLCLDLGANSLGEALILFFLSKHKKLEALSKGKDRNPEMQIHDLEGNIWGTSGQFECGIVFGVEVALGYEEICSDSSGNRVFIRRNNGYMKLIKPFTMENILMSRLCREKMYMEENMFSPFPSHCNSFSRPLVLLMVQRIL
ncbi:hypothetical protein HID58_071981 [Brassica napus]|uniref:Uncharacterized protein n=1 Tax=Brassica napus TaxID=3708 RepID=A0ABQ7Z352_BRANA|nr:hypothetical protein HID58_071981 [Brassica napus]